MATIITKAGVAVHIGDHNSRSVQVTELLFSQVQEIVILGKYNIDRFPGTGFPKIACIKTVKAIFNLDLYEAKALVEAAYENPEYFKNGRFE